MRPKLALNEGVGDLADRVDPDALFLQVFADRGQAALTPDAGTLVAAERRKVARRPASVDPDRSRLEALGHGEGGPDALGPHARCKPYCVLLAISIASSSSSKVITDRTGPNTSSCAS